MGLALWSGADSEQANLIGNSWQIFPNLSPFAGSEWVCVFGKRAGALAAPSLLELAGQLTAAARGECATHACCIKPSANVQSSAEQLRPAADWASCWGKGRNEAWLVGWLDGVAREGKVTSHRAQVNDWSRKAEIIAMRSTGRPWGWYLRMGSIVSRAAAILPVDWFRRLALLWLFWSGCENYLHYIVLLDLYWKQAALICWSLLRCCDKLFNCFSFSH